MNAAEHKAEAERLAGVLTHPDVALMTNDDIQTSLQAAQIHATLATLQDPVPVEPPADPLWDSPLYAAAALLERVAVGHDGPEREYFLARVVLGDSIVRGADLAVHALHAARDGGNVALVKAVEAAIVTLGISTDAD